MNLKVVKSVKNMNYQALNVLAFSSFIALTGCAGSMYDSEFKCPPGEGVGCKSASAVDKMITNGQINIDEDVATKITDTQVYVYYGPDQTSRLISVNTTLKENK